MFSFDKINIKKKKKSETLSSFILFILAICICSSCKDDNLIYNVDNKDYGDDIIKIRASIFPSVNSRSFYSGDEIKDIDHGTFYLTYPIFDQNATADRVKYGNPPAIVQFGNSEDPYTGFAAYEKDGVLKDLKWSKIYGGGTKDVYLYLHNISPDLYRLYTGSQLYNAKDYQRYDFDTSKNPYKASPLDTVNGSNDLIIIGGETSNAYSVPKVNANTKTIEYNLYHRMAMIRLNIEVFKSEDGRPISLDNAEIYITNIYSELKSVNLSRCYDSGFKEESDLNKSSNNSDYRCSYGSYGGFVTDDETLLNTTGTYKPVGESILLVKEDTPCSWKKLLNDEGNLVNYRTDVEKIDGKDYEKNIYQAQDFVFPPQQFREGFTPKITVVIPKKDVTGREEEGFKTYTGYIPTVMYEADSNGQITSWAPIDTRLNSGYILHLTARIDSPNADLSFAPARVENWVGKGSYTISIRKAGIYTANDLLTLISCYKEGKISELEKYGFKEKNGENGYSYNFQFWSSFSIEKDLINNKLELNDDVPFSFLLNNYTVTLDKDTEHEQKLKGFNGQQELYEIITGQKDVRYQGIRSAEDMKNLVDLCRLSENYPEPDKNKLMKYGSINTFENIWTFKLEEDIQVNIEDIWNSIDPEFLRADVSIDLNGHSLTFYIGNKSLVCNSAEDAIVAHRFCVKKAEGGIYSEREFYLLKQLYNEFLEEEPDEIDFLSLFGNQNSSGTWIINFKTSMTLILNDFLASMIPEADNIYKPVISFSTSSPYYTLDFIDNKIPFSISTSSSINNIIKGTGHCTNINPFSPSSTSSLTTYYYANNYYKLLNDYGRFENGKWVFILDYPSSSGNTQNVKYKDLYGALLTDESEGKWDFEFELGKPVRVDEMPVSENSSETVALTFTQNGSSNTNNLPNSAADLKKIANGTYWDNFPVEP